MPKWFEFRTATPAMPCARARSIPRSTARAVRTWPMPWCPSSTTSGPESVTTVGRVTGSIAPLRSRAVYQGRRSIPCDESPTARP